MEEYKQQFIDFMVKSEALLFGDFITKAGRPTPYFINTGRFQTAEQISTLGYFYATHIHTNNLDSANVIFGPAYKGISLCVTTAINLFSHYQHNISFSFNRKEDKDHGDKGRFVGKSIDENDKVIIVEDVVSAGTTFREVMPLLSSLSKAKVLGAVIAVDRCEKGKGAQSATTELKDELNMDIFPIVTVHEIVEYLSGDNISLKLSSTQIDKIHQYLEKYGA